MRAQTILSVCGLAGALFALPLTTTSLSAQTRDELIRQAQQHYDNFETEPALNNLKAALDPTRGPRDWLWGHAVHLLAQIYVEENNPGLAQSWLRWAMRLNPNMRVDEALFLPEVIDASDEARQFARSTASAGDSVAETTWDWALGRTIQNAGQIRIQPSGLTAPVRVLVGGRQIEEVLEIDKNAYGLNHPNVSRDLNFKAVNWNKCSGRNNVKNFLSLIKVSTRLRPNGQLFSQALHNVQS